MKLAKEDLDRDKEKKELEKASVQPAMAPTKPFEQPSKKRILLN